MPPSALSSSPGFAATAPVNAPFSCPNSSLSSSVSASAAQLRRRNGLSRRGGDVGGSQRGEHLLADPGLAEDQDVDVAARRLPHLVERREHGRRAQDDLVGQDAVTAGAGGRECAAQGLVAGAERPHDEDEVADVDRVARRDLHRLAGREPLVVEHRPVGRAEVLDRERVAAHVQDRMPARHLRAVEADRGVGRAADRELPPVRYRSSGDAQLTDDHEGVTGDFAQRDVTS